MCNELVILACRHVEREGTGATSSVRPGLRPGTRYFVLNDTTSMTVDHGRSKSLSYFVAHNNQQGCINVQQCG